MDGRQKYGPFLGTLKIRCRITIGNQTGTIILTTTHMGISHLIRQPTGHTVDKNPAWPYVH